MGIVYHVFQHLAIESMEWGRDKGKIVDKERVRENKNKHFAEAKEIIDYDVLDRHWDDLMQESWDHLHDNPAFRKKGKKFPVNSD